MLGACRLDIKAKKKAGRFFFRLYMYMGGTKIVVNRNFMMCSTNRNQLFIILCLLIGWLLRNLSKAEGDQEKRGEGRAVTSTRALACDAFPRDTCEHVNNYKKT